MFNTLTPDLEQFVQREVASGRYATREAVIVHALRLMQQEQAEALHGIQAGLEDVAAGRTHSLSAAFDDLRRELNIPSDA